MNGSEANSKCNLKSASKIKKLHKVVDCEKVRCKSYIYIRVHNYIIFKMKMNIIKKNAKFLRFSTNLNKLLHFIE